MSALTLPLEGLELAPTGVLPLLGESHTDPIADEALSSVWLRRVVAFADYIGPGRQLTAKGNLRLADARVLTALLETGEALEVTHGAYTYKVRSATELELLDLTRELARACGMVEDMG